MPHVEVTNLAGDVFRYSTIWQHKNFVLVLLAAGGVDDRYVSEVTARLSDFHERETELLDWVEYVQRRCPESEGEAK